VALDDEYHAGFLSTSYRCWDHFLSVSVVSHAVPDRHFVLVFGRGFCECQQQMTTFASALVLCFGAGVNKLTHDDIFIQTLLELG
jgi:hypothetical protein